MNHHGGECGLGSWARMKGWRTASPSERPVLMSTCAQDTCSLPCVHTQIRPSLEVSGTSAQSTVPRQGMWV